MISYLLRVLRVVLGIVSPSVVAAFRRSPTVTTPTPHGLVSGNVVTIGETTFVVDVLSATTFATLPRSWLARREYRLALKQLAGRQSLAECADAEARATVSEVKRLVSEGLTPRARIVLLSAHGTTRTRKTTARHLSRTSDR
jgi:hypothetical protein